MNDLNIHLEDVVELLLSSSATMVWDLNCHKQSYTQISFSTSVETEQIFMLKLF